ncbi:apolipoprotein D [Hyalella azteca]|uniref:Apolipoprotein D n=1 Tax=Hyalella azteca TaxID=294128 RepID=A0A8B7P3I2_HYAAZ|nr:apolipoprotein D [Hyalella azteca]
MIKVIVLAALLGSECVVAQYSAAEAHSFSKRQATDDTLGTAPGTIVPGPADSGPDQTPQCPKPPVVQNFQAERYLGRWYEIERFTAPFQTGICVTADYALLGNCSIGVTNTQVLPNGVVDVARGVAHSAGDPGSASLTVTFPDEERTRGPVQTPQTEGNYNVLATDYENYAVVYSCSIANFRGRDTKFEFSWVLARQPRVNSVFLRRLHEWLQNLGVPAERYMLTRQVGCQYTAS